MKTLLIGSLVLLASINTYSGVDMHDFETTSGQVTKVSDASFEKVWSSSTPACIKDVSKTIKQNAAYKKLGLKKADCSDTPKAKARQELLGYTVIKFSLTSLSKAYAKQALGIK